MKTVDRISSVRLTPRATIKGRPVFVRFGNAIFVKDSVTGKLFAVGQDAAYRSTMSYYGKITVKS